MAEKPGTAERPEKPENLEKLGIVPTVVVAETAETAGNELKCTKAGITTLAMIPKLLARLHQLGIQKLQPVDLQGDMTTTYNRWRQVSSAPEQV